MKLTAVAPRGLRLDWDKHPDAIRYSVGRDVEGRDSINAYANLAFLDSPDTLTHTVKDLSLVEALRHAYRVRACNSQTCELQTLRLAVEDAPGMNGLADAITVIPEASTTTSATGFGHAMATAQYWVGRVFTVWMAVGAPGGRTVSLYARPEGSSAWTLVQSLPSPSGAPDGFGTSVSLSPDGQWLAVGAPDDDSGGANINPNALADPIGGSGAAYVYWRYPGVLDGVTVGATTWTFVAKIKAPRPGQGDAFGSAVAIANNGNLVVGAPLEDSDAEGFQAPDTTALDNDKQDDSGAAYLYSMRPSLPSFLSAIFKPVRVAPASATANAHFGAAVATSDRSQVVVGAPWGALPLVGGAVQVFVPDLVNLPRWRLQAHLQTPSANAQSVERRLGFGSSLSLGADGTLLAVGQPDWGPTLTGAAHVYETNYTQWSLQQSLTSPTQQDFGRFGMSVALQSDSTRTRLLVGSRDEGSALPGLQHFEDLTTTPPLAPNNSGAAFYYERLNGVWVGRARLKAPVPKANEHRGRAVAITPDGSEMLVGAQDARTVLGY